MKSLLFLSLLAILLSACASSRIEGLGSLPLPASNSGQCCWQAFQQLEIHYKNQTYQLNAALAQAPGTISLVLLDPLGRRLLSVQEDAQGKLSHYRSPELPKQLPARFLLASSLLAWWPMDDWQSLLAGQTNWHLTLAPHSRLLSYRGKPLLRASYSPSPSQSLRQGLGQWTQTRQEILTLTHMRQPLRIKVSTTNWSPLQ